MAGDAEPPRAHPTGIAGVHEVLKVMATACRHPRVRIVSRHDDTEFVECLECGEIFESSEFKDMSIEERTQGGDL